MAKVLNHNSSTKLLECFFANRVGELWLTNSDNQELTHLLDEASNKVVEHTTTQLSRIISQII